MKIHVLNFSITWRALAIKSKTFSIIFELVSYDGILKQGQKLHVEVNLLIYISIFTISFHCTFVLIWSDLLFPASCDCLIHFLSYLFYILFALLQFQICKRSSSNSRFKLKLSQNWLKKSFVCENREPVQPFTNFIETVK